MHVRPVMALHAGARSLLDANVGVSDMCLLEPLDEDNFIDNLHRRFMHDQIYVSSLFFLNVGGGGGGVLVLFGIMKHWHCIEIGSGNE